MMTLASKLAAIFSGGTPWVVRMAGVNGLLISGVALLAMLSVSPADAKPLQFNVAPDEKSQVLFTSDAPVEIIRGLTNDVSGQIRFDDSLRFDKKHPFQVHFAVNLDHLDTGIELRNQHMRDKYLETARYPQATFDTTNVKIAEPPTSLKHKAEVDLVAVGNFTVHGKTVEKTIPLKVSYRPGSSTRPASINVRGKFTVPLADHNIERPEIVTAKLAEKIFVTLDLYGTAE